MQENRVAVSVIIPTLNEAANLRELVTRIDAAMAADPQIDSNYEILIVDDASRDGTPGACAELASAYPLRLLVRTHPTDGLSGAVLHGMAHAGGEILVVMDADLQHPPERLPALIAPLRQGRADFVLGSRYVAGGSTSRRWGLFRRLNSGLATLLAAPFAGRTHDPMSGFFALSESTWRRADSLAPMGYKVGLELICKCRAQRVLEVPIHFDTRRHGKSKLTLAQQFKYLEHLSRLYDFCFPRWSPMLKFAIVTLVSWFVAWGAYVRLIHGGHGMVAAPVLAYAAALAVAKVFHERYVRAQRQFLSVRRPRLLFAACAAIEWLVCAAVAAWVRVRIPSATVGEVFVYCFAAATIARYVMRKEFRLDVRGFPPVRQRPPRASSEARQTGRCIEQKPAHSAAGVPTGGMMLQSRSRE